MSTLSELANLPAIAESFAASTTWPNDGPAVHHVMRSWRTTADGPTFHEPVAGPFETEAQADAALASMKTARKS